MWPNKHPKLVTKSDIGREGIHVDGDITTKKKNKFLLIKPDLHS